MNYILNFTKEDNGLFVSNEIEIMENFNLHIEFEEKGTDVMVATKTAGYEFGKYIVYKNDGINFEHEPNIGKVFPKTIKVATFTSVNIAIITTGNTRTDSQAENEEIIAAALNDLNTRIG
ncbi:MAG: hypothetical protein MJZ26_09055 [Fibrobacter sp.]|nr:hypothetical protein [Fibrobacter sp.]